jgi:hypothetical protein
MSGRGFMRPLQVLPHLRALSRKWEAVYTEPSPSCGEVEDELLVASNIVQCRALVVPRDVSGVALFLISAVRFFEVMDFNASSLSSRISHVDFPQKAVEAGFCRCLHISFPHLLFCSIFDICSTRQVVTTRPLGFVPLSFVSAVRCFKHHLAGSSHQAFAWRDRGDIGKWSAKNTKHSAFIPVIQFHSRAN